MADYKTITDYIDQLQDVWQQTSIVDRIDNIRSLIDSEGYPQGLDAIITYVLGLSADGRRTLIAKLRARQQILEWAKNSDNAADILDVVGDLQDVADQKDPNEE